MADGDREPPKILPPESIDRSGRPAGVVVGSDEDVLMYGSGTVLRAVTTDVHHS